MVLLQDHSPRGPGMAAPVGSPMWQKLLGPGDEPPSCRSVLGKVRTDWAVNEAGRP